MADELIDILGIYDPVRDKKTGKAIDHVKMKDVFAKIEDVLNNDVARESGNLVTDSTLTKEFIITDAVGDKQARIKFIEAHTFNGTSVTGFVFQDNTGTNDSPIWKDRFAMDLQSAGKFHFNDNTAARFPDGSLIKSEDFNSSGNVILTKDQGDITFSAILFGDTDGDSNQWQIDEDGNGDLRIQHNDLPDTITLNQSGELQPLKLENRNSDPSVGSGDSGRIWLRTDL